MLLVKHVKHVLNSKHQDRAQRKNICHLLRQGAQSTEKMSASVHGQMEEQKPRWQGALQLRQISSHHFSNLDFAQLGGQSSCECLHRPLSILGFSSQRLFAYLPAHAEIFWTSLIVTKGCVPSLLQNERSWLRSCMPSSFLFSISFKPQK